MADITLHCPSCAKQITVSEYVDRSMLTCRSCGASFRDAPSGDEETNSLQEHSQAEDGTPDDISQVSDTPTPAHSQSPAHNTVIASVPRNRRTRFRWTHALTAWTLMGCLSVIALYIRFGGWLNEDHILWIESYGPIILLALHVYVVLTAFRDAVVQGVLCLLIPFYSTYYIMILSYDYIARALIGAAIMGLGWDSLHVMIKEAEAILPAINDWLNSGI